MAEPNDADRRLGLFQVFLERHEWGTAADMERSINEAGLHLVTAEDEWKCVAERDEAHLLVAELEAELRKYEPSDGVMVQRLGYLTTIKEAAELLADCRRDDTSMRTWDAVDEWLKRPQVAQARKL